MIYLITWLVLSNIMLLNLMIALFSDTYSKLQKVGEGLYLIEIIEVSPEKRYDEFYSGLISCPYPFTVLLLPLLPFYACLKNKRFNELVLRIEHGIVVFCVVIPFALILSPFALVIAYIKCVFNKLSLIFKKQSR